MLVWVEDRVTINSILTGITERPGSGTGAGHCTNARGF